MNHLKKSGVYKITYLGDESKFYVGSSKNCYKRWHKHKYDCNRDLPYQSYLHNAMRNYGIENFKVDLIEECEPYGNQLREREQHYIDTLQPVYNIIQFTTQSGHDWSPLRKAEYSARRKAEVAAGIRVPPPSPTTGNKDFRHSEESKQKMQKSITKARARIAQERDSYITPEGMASRRTKLEVSLTPERRRRYAESNEENLILARAKQQEQADAFAEKYLAIIQGMLGDMNLCQIADRLNADGHGSPRDGVQWTDQTIRQILKRMDQPLKTRTQCLEVAEQTRKANADAFARKFLPIIDALAHQGMNLSEIAKKLNQDGHKSRRGADWTYQNVREVRKRGKNHAMIEPEVLSEPAKRFIGWGRK